MGLTLPFVVVGLAFNLRAPSLFSVGGPSPALKLIAAVGLLCGLTGWLWSAVLIALRVPRGELITTGPYRWVKHPLYTSVALLALPSLGLLLDSWLGVAIGLVLYIASRILSPAEERQLLQRFGQAWEAYCVRVKLPWL
jgi:protein-S-isoprenylcysteine O-methyltransferase Ste14